MTIFFFSCGSGFDPDTKGPVVTLVYPHDGYVASDSVLIKYDTEDDAQVLSMELQINDLPEGSMYPDPVEIGVFYYWLNVLERDPSAIIIKGIAEDEFGNTGESEEVEIFIDNDLRFVNVFSGEFVSSNGEETEMDYDYQIMTFPVTVGQYLAFLNSAHQNGQLWQTAGLVKGKYKDDNWPEGNYPFLDLGGNQFGYNTGSIVWDGEYFVVMDSLFIDHPVTQVTWFGAQAFAHYYQMRLPTINEWEKAARGIQGKLYPWGNSISPLNANYSMSDDPFETGTTPVGYFSMERCDDNNGDWIDYFLYGECDYEGFITHDSPSHIGAYDLAGNVWEWTSTTSEGLNENDPNLYIQKGGSFLNIATSQSTTSFNTSYPEIGLVNFGFRCVRNL